MRSGFSRLLALTCLLSAVAASPARAQQHSWGDLSVSGVGMNFDLSGTGNAPGLAVRAAHDLSDHVVLEFRSLFARPEQQSGRTTLIVPEVQLQYRWNVARLTPFVGAGGGTAFRQSPFSTGWDATVSFSGGAGVRLTEQLGLIGEMRLRGVEYDFTGTIAEWGVGLTWRLPAF